MTIRIIKKNTGSDSRRQVNASRGGFTIIETMITISIFFIVVVIGMGAVLNANLLHNKSQNMRSIMDNLNFIMEDMSKNIRTGYNYRCYDASGSITNDSSIDVAKSCANTNGWGIAFKSSIGNTWSYYVNNNGNIFRSTNGAADFYSINS